MIGIFALCWDESWKSRFFTKTSNFKAIFGIFRNELTKFWPPSLELDFNVVFTREDRFEKSFLFLEIIAKSHFFQKQSFWSFWKGHFIMGFRQNDKLWRAVTSVSDEIFANPFQPRNYIHISFILAHKIFLTDRTKNLENRSRPERVNRFFVQICSGEFTIDNFWFYNLVKL